MGDPLIVRTSAEMTAWSGAAHARGQRIAFVPTMGALHEGHLTLLRDGRRRAEQLVLSIFVNPTQFGPNGIWPATRAIWPAIRPRRGAPAPTWPSCPRWPKIYPLGFQTTVEVGELSRGLDGPFRPGHFAGVATVVAKLFNIVRPDLALFGEKDFQQLAIVRRMVADLAMGIEIVGVPIVREAGRAGHVVAQRLPLGVPSAGARCRSRARSSPPAIARRRGRGTRAALVQAARAVLDVDRLDYLELCDASTLTPVARLDRPCVLAVADLHRPHPPHRQRAAQLNVVSVIVTPLVPSVLSLAST